MTTAVATGSAALSAADRCDRCGAQAYLKVELQSGGELLFCAHHAREHGDAQARRRRRDRRVARLADNPTVAPPRSAEVGSPTDDSTAPDQVSGAVGFRRVAAVSLLRCWSRWRSWWGLSASWCRSSRAWCWCWRPSSCRPSTRAPARGGSCSRSPRPCWSSARSSSTPSRPSPRDVRHPVVDDVVRGRARRGRVLRHPDDRALHRFVLGSSSPSTAWSAPCGRAVDPGSPSRPSGEHPRLAAGPSGPGLVRRRV